MNVTDTSILFRWATEDPNPGEKIAEEKRIEGIGQKAIAGMLDEDLVEATQAVRALEDGDVEDFYHIEASKPEEEEEEDRPAKKSKSEGGFFNADALDNIKFYAELAKKQAEEEREKVRKVPARQVGMSLLGGYGSGDESD